MPFISRRSNVKKLKFGILFVLAVLALVSVASAALPTTVTANIQNPGIASASYWGVTVTGHTGPGTDIPNMYYDGWCGSVLAQIGNGGHTFNVYSSFAPPSGLPTQDWRKVNWVLNHNNVIQADPATLQAVFWYYDSGPYSWGTVDTVKMGQLIAGADAAILADPNYMPAVGEKYAVILWTTDHLQPIFIVQTVQNDSYPPGPIPSPEFPTLALPVAMMIGVVGVVQYVKGRKE
jgi:hypothetical protein